MTQPTARIVVLTPELAKKLLAANKNNRNVSEKNYAKIARAMKRGEWELNGEAIKVAKDGTLLDGQHRCHAVVATGVAIETFLIEGLPNTAQETMDQGKTRTLANYLAMRGEKNASRLAAAIASLYIFDRYDLERAVKNTGRPDATVREQLDFFDQNEWIRDLVVPLRAIQQAAYYPGIPMLAPLYVAFDLIDADDAKGFWEQVEKGVGLHEKHPILHLRKALRSSYEDVRGERNTRYLAALTIKAWNAFRAGQDTGRLQWRAGGANPETFPVPR